MGTTSADSLGDPGIGGALIGTLGAPAAASQFINHGTPGR